ncbi:MAG: energy transducer TonB [Nitrospira sp.]|nr:energy transducer TonB [Nitrospira sp.]
MERRHNLMFCIFLALWCTLTSNSISLAENSSDSSEPIETLDVIEVTGTTVTKTSRTFSFPLPTLNHPWPPPAIRYLEVPDLEIGDLPQPPRPRILLDQIGTTRGRSKSVKPLHTERPLYPRMAREQGWQGKVVLRTHISADGTVTSATVQESSGYSLLDESAVQAVKVWSFEPAKNGEFVVSSTVDLPIRFDLLQ